MPHIMEDYIRHKISLKLRQLEELSKQPKYKFCAKTCTETIPNYLIVQIHQTLCSKPHAYFELSFSHSKKALTTGNYRLPMELTALIGLSDDILLSNTDPITGCHNDPPHGIIYFSRSEFRQQKLSQLLHSN